MKPAKEIIKIRIENSNTGLYEFAYMTRKQYADKYTHTGFVQHGNPITTIEVEKSWWDFIRIFFSIQLLHFWTNETIELYLESKLTKTLLRLKEKGK